jgi:hypothetical protein
VLVPLPDGNSSNMHCMVVVRYREVGSIKRVSKGFSCHWVACVVSLKGGGTSAEIWG